MEAKKTKRSDLENKKLMFFQIGILISMSLVLIAFEWTSKPKSVSDYTGTPIENIVEEDVAITYRKPPVQKPPQVMQPIFTVVPDIVKPDEPDMNWTSDVTQNDAIDWKFTPKEEATVDDIPYRYVQDMPKFENGGLDKFLSYVYSKIKYPPLAVEYGLEGKVTLEFVIDKSGKLTNVSVVRGAYPVLDEEALRVVSSSPKWTPGRQNGEPVKVAYYMPINFELRK